MNYHLDTIEECELLIFSNYAEVKRYINQEFGEVQSFVSNPIEIVDEGEGMKFGRLWDLVDRFQSGKVQYNRR